MSAFEVKYLEDKIVDIASCLKIIKETKPDMFLGGTYLRGQEKYSWELLPTIGREHEWAGVKIKSFNESQEKLLFHRFRRYSYLHFNRSLNEWEALFLARHHGLPVRLLDWTNNPLVALYWACQPINSDESGAIYMLQRKPKFDDFLDIYDPNYISPLEIIGIRTIAPLHVSPRISAQGSIFTIQDDPRTPIEKLMNRKFGQSECDIHSLYKWEVPHKFKNGILKELEKSGINIRTLFQDLDGLCAGLWRTEVMRETVF